MVRRTLWRLMFWSLFAMLVVWAIWFVRSLEPFGHCIHQRKNYEAYQALHKEAFFIIRLFIRFELNGACAGHVANVYQGPITALSGAVVAIFTGTLWWITRRSVKATEIAAAAARDGVELSRNSFIVENRAYVTPVEFKPDKIIDAHTGRIAKWRLTPQWQNTGKTPAKRVRHLTNGKYFPAAGMPDDFNFPDNQRNGLDRGIGRVIGPSFTMPGPELEIDAVIFRDVMKHHRFFIWSWIEYHDVFLDMPIRRSEWCVELIVSGDITDPRVDFGGVAQLHSVDRFNGADEDCYRQPGVGVPLMTPDDTAPQFAGLPRLYLTSSFSMPWPGWPETPP